MSSRQVAQKIFQEALEASLPKNFLSKKCKLEGEVLFVNQSSYDLSSYKNIYVFGSGKAAATMAFEMEKILGDRLYRGLVVAPDRKVSLKKIELHEGSHPLPDEKSLNATEKLIEMMQECGEDDLYIYLLSGGSSALIELPIEPISLEDLQETTELMLHNALEIQEMNIVRKHLSCIKGGKLATYSKAKGVVLVLSDIIDDDLYSIGSAPLYADRSSYGDAKALLESKDIFYELPQSVQDILEKGISGLIEETPKEVSQNVSHHILASNRLALNSAYESALSQGLRVEKVEDPMQGDVNSMLKEIFRRVENSKAECLLFGGECTVSVKGEGMGGRNQHMVALMLKEIKQRGVALSFLSAGTDGIDGNSDAAGAFISLESSREVDEKTLEEYIERFDSYNLFKRMNALVTTGPTGTNVIDIAIVIKGE